MFTPELEFLARYLDRLRGRLARAVADDEDTPDTADEAGEDDLAPALDAGEGLEDDDFAGDDEGEEHGPLGPRDEETETLPIFELMARYGLDETEADILLFAAAPALDPSVGAVIAAACAPQPMDWAAPFGWLRAISVDDPALYWQEQYRFGEDQPLMRSGLVELAPRELGPRDRLRQELVVPGDVVALLRGERALDERCLPVLERDPGFVPVPCPALADAWLDRLQALIAGHFAGGDRAAVWGAAHERADLVLLSGGRGVGKTLAVQWACQRLGVPVLRLEAAMLASRLNHEVEQTVTHAVRQAALHREVLLIDAGELLLLRGSPGAAALVAAARRYHALVFVVTRAPEALDERLRDMMAVRVILPAPRLEVSQHAWQLALNTFGFEDVDARKAAARYPLDGRQIFNSARAAGLFVTGADELAAIPDEELVDSELDEATFEAASEARRAAVAEHAAALVAGAVGSGGDDDDTALVDDAEVSAAASLLDARQQALAYAAITQLDDNLGKLGIADGHGATLEDLVLSKEQRSQVNEIISAFRHWHTLYNDWGFGERIHRGRGLICLFDGEPGTGKTLSAEVLAGHLGLKLVRINTGQVIDKYIGETEKRLTEIFDRAHPGLNLLLFDEADSLFGKRTKVERSTDRYANAAINVLLQLVEHYEGLVVLTTNLKQGIDPAFERRFTYKLRFQVPTAKQRAKIWRRLIPETAPVADDIDFAYLGRELELSGGGIKTAVIRAAYLALKAGKSLGMEHLMEAGYRELAAGGKLVRHEF